MTIVYMRQGTYNLEVREKRKMKSSRKGITWFLLSLLTLSQIALPLTAYAAYSKTSTPFNVNNLTFTQGADTSKNYISDGTYKFTAQYFKSNITYDPYLVNCGALLDVNILGWHVGGCTANRALTDAYNNNVLYFLNQDFPTDSNDTTMRYAIAIPNTHASSGNITGFVLAGTSNDDKWEKGNNVQISNAQFAKSLNKITVGSIAGEILPIDWTGTAPADKLPGLTFELDRSDTGEKVLTSKDFESNGHYYYSMDLSKAPGGFLYEGKYVIKHSHKEQGDCNSGNAKTNLSLSQACTFDFEASMKFTLLATSNGDGTITIDPSNDLEEVNSNGNGKLLSQFTGTNGIGANVDITYTMASPLDGVISGAISLVAKGVNSTLSFVMTQIERLLNGTEDFVLGQANSGTPALNAPWVIIKNLALSLLVMALIIIAFANVVQVDIEQYGLNRMIPKIIISIVMAMASWLIVTFFFDMSAAIQAQAKGLTQSVDIIAGLKTLQITTPSNGAILADVGSLIMIIVVFVGVLLCAIVLLFLLLIRSVFLAFLLVIAPLAFIFNILPFTQGLTKQWWTEFFKWMFMGPIAMAIIAIGEIIAASASGGALSAGSVAIDATSKTNAHEAVLFGLVIFAAALYMAATLPLQWGGKIMSSWGNIGKKAWGMTGGKAVAATGKAVGAYTVDPFKKAMAARRAQIDEGREAFSDSFGNRMLNTATRGKYGMKQGAMDQVVFQNRTAKAAARMQLKYMDPDEAKQFATSKDPHEQAAYKQHLASTNDLDQYYARNKNLVQGGAWLTNKEYLEKFNTANLKDSKGNQLAALTENSTVEERATAEAVAKTYMDKQQRQAVTLAGLDLAKDGGHDAVLADMVKNGQGEVFLAGYNALNRTDADNIAETEATSGFTAAELANEKGKIGDLKHAAERSSAQTKGMISGYKGKSLRAVRAALFDHISSEQVAGLVSSDVLDTGLHTASVVTEKLKSKGEGLQARMERFAKEGKPGNAAAKWLEPKA